VGITSNNSFTFPQSSGKSSLHSTKNLTIRVCETWHAVACSSHARATATSKQERPKKGEKEKPSKLHLKVTSMHMEVRALFGRIV